MGGKKHEEETLGAKHLNIEDCDAFPQIVTAIFIK